MAVSSMKMWQKQMILNFELPSHVLSKKNVIGKHENEIRSFIYTG